MKARPFWIVCVLFSWPAWAGPSAPVAAAEEKTIAPSALYTASDFPRLAQGVDAGFTGDATIHIWAPSQDEWHLTSGAGTHTLHYQVKSSDRLPRWRSIGQVNLVKGQPFKVAVADDRAKDGQASGSRSAAKAESKAKAKAASDDQASVSRSAAKAESKAKAKAAPDEKASVSRSAAKAESKAKAKTAPKPLAPVPALLWVSAKTDSPDSTLLDMVRGRIETVEPTLDHRRSQARTNNEGADFQAPATAAAWRDRAQHLREQMLVTLGLWPAFPKTPLNPQIYGKLDRDDYTIEKVVLETLPGFTLSGNLYRPANQCDRAPAILCPHGHWDDGRMNPEVQQRCIRWAKLGCVVFMYDMVGYNDSKPFTHEFLNDRLRRWGLSLPTLQAWNSIRALDWLSSLPDVDPSRLGCTGESGGGTQTFLLTALDDRIKVSAPIVMVSDTFQGGCVCENAAGLRHGTDNVEFAALCAPRPLVLVGATGDWTAKTMTRAFPAIRGVYSLVGTLDRVSAEVFDFPHNYNQTTRNAVYAKMSHWLLGINDPATTREGKQSPEKPEDLFTFNAEHVAPKDRKTPEQLESYLIATLGHQIDDLAPSSSSARWEAASRLLATSLKIRVGLENPAAENLVHQEVRRVTREGLTIVHSVVGRRLAGDAIPVVRLLPARSTGRLTIIVQPRGKAALATSTGEPSSLTHALLALGQSVVAFDPLFVGESLDSSNPVARRPEVVHFETYNPTVAADQMQDLATVLAWAKAQPDVREVSVIAQGLSGPQVLLARPALSGLARTVIDLGGLPDPSDSGSWPASIDLPGMFQFGGFKAAAALTAPAPLLIHGAPASFDATWPKASYALNEAAHVLKLEPRDPDPEQLAQWIDRGE